MQLITCPALGTIRHFILLATIFMSLTYFFYYYYVLVIVELVKSFLSPCVIHILI